MSRFIYFRIYFWLISSRCRLNFDNNRILCNTYRPMRRYSSYDEYPRLLLKYSILVIMMCGTFRMDSFIHVVLAGNLILYYFYGIKVTFLFIMINTVRITNFLVKSHVNNLCSKIIELHIDLVASESKHLCNQDFIKYSEPQQTKHDTK